MANSMSDAEKQERQKTVVAFIAGLLVGGLLVWIFSSATTSPADEQVNDGLDDDDTSVVVEGDVMGDTTTNNDNVMDTTPSGSEVSGSTHTDSDGTLVVRNQPVSLEVAISNIAYPTTDGWIVVKDYEGGQGTGILGAARYSTGVGLLPESVELLRPTISGSEYQVVFYTENGDRIFDTATDVVMDDAVSTTFRAQ